MDVYLREAGGVVVDDDLDRRDIQAPVRERERCRKKTDDISLSPASWEKFSTTVPELGGGSAPYRAATSVAIRIL